MGEEHVTIPKHQSTKRKLDLDDELVVLSSNYYIMVGVDSGLRYLFIAKNNDNVEDKKKSVKMSSQQYYNDTKFNWKWDTSRDPTRYIKHG